MDNLNERCDNECCTICNTTLIRLSNVTELHHTGPLLDPNTRCRRPPKDSPRKPRGFADPFPYNSTTAPSREAEREYYDD